MKRNRKKLYAGIGAIMMSGCLFLQPLQAFGGLQNLAGRQAAESAGVKGQEEMAVRAASQSAALKGKADQTGSEENDGNKDGNGKEEKTADREINQGKIQGGYEANEEGKEEKTADQEINQGKVQGGYEVSEGIKKTEETKSAEEFAEGDETRRDGALAAWGFGGTEEDAEPETLEIVYEMLAEEEYGASHWSAFFRKYPRYANAQGDALHPSLKAMFLPYYSMTVSKYAGQETFGVWEIYEETDGGEAQSCGYYAYGAVWKDGARESADTWIALEEAERQPYYANFRRHTLSASVINKNTLRISIDVDVWDSSGGDNGYCHYQLAPIRDINSFSGGMLNAWVDMENSYRASKGTLSANSFSSKSSSSGNGSRTLIFQGYWDLSGEDLAELKKNLNGNQLYWAAGFMRSGSYSMSNGEIYCSNLSAAVNQAACAHTQKKYTQIADNAGTHNVLCASCGLHLAAEGHQRNAESGRCTACGYLFAVTGTLRYELNGREVTESYEALPGAEYRPKEFEGYRTPAAVLIPQKGGELLIHYEPIAYRLLIGETEHSLSYDDSFLLPETERKGCRQAAYAVRAVS